MATTSLPPSSLMPERLEFTLSEFYLARRFFGYNGIDFGGNHNSPTYLLLGESTFCKRSHYASIQKRKGRNSWDHQEIPMPLEDRKSWVSSLLVILSGFQQPRGPLLCLCSLSPIYFSACLAREIKYIELIIAGDDMVGVAKLNST
jgi:hypothetical protein